MDDILLAGSNGATFRKKTFNEENFAFLGITNRSWKKYDEGDFIYFLWYKIRGDTGIIG